MIHRFDSESILPGGEPVRQLNHATTHAIDTYELSPMQAGMLFHAVSDRHSGVDIEQVVAMLHEPLDEARFVRAWQRVTHRHAILRSRFRWEGLPAQDVLAHVHIPVERLDWRALGESERRRRFEGFIEEDRTRGVDLNHAPLMRLALVRVADREHWVLWTFHHALLDGRSFPLVLREVFAFYGDDDIDLPLPRPYHDHIDRLRAFDESRARHYWHSALAGFRAPTPLVVARDREVENVTGSVWGAHEVRLSAALTTTLRERAREASVTVNTLLQGAWALLLHRYSGEQDIVFGATRACRRSTVPGAEKMVGLFINTLPLRVRIDRDAELIPWLQQLRAQQVALREYEQTPLAKVQAWSEVPRGTPLFESIVVYENQTLDAQLRALGGAWKRRRFQYYGQTNFPLTLAAYGDDELLLQLQYSPRRFDDTSVARMLGHLSTVLGGMAARLSTPLKDLPLLTEAERRQAVSGWNVGQCYPRGACLHQRFEQQAERAPDAVALIYEGQELRYAELNRRANRLAHRLRALGVTPDQLVGLRVERGIEMVIGILGILKSGGAYLPLDTAYPKQRVAFMLEDSRVDIVVTQQALAADFEGIAVRRLFLDEPLAADDTNPAPVTSADNLAYVIYTSGSTGKPKGALITHYNVTRLFEATEPWYHFDRQDVWTLFHSYAFDFSVWELWGALLYGGRIVIVPYWVSRSPEAFRDLLIREGVTVLSQTPSAFRQLIQADLSQPQADLALRYVIFGGEALELQSLRPWFERYGDARPRLVNMYGITETTVHVTYRPIRREDLESGQGSVIGIPIPDLQVYLLDPAGAPVPIGVPGEIYVGGAGVARGYLNRPELSAQRFVPDPFSSTPGATLYRTGDLAHRLENGDIEYLGRIDSQVKIRGFRIELGEIEAGIARHPAIREVVVLAREDVPGDKRLVAYLVADNAPVDLADQLRALLRASMPDYMVPGHFVTLDALPLTENGKVDRRALPEPRIYATVGQTYTAPRTPTERTIAQIWSAVLGAERVGIHDHFFELGGDSILSIQVIARCRQAALHLTPKDLFTYPTIAKLAQRCVQIPMQAAASQETLTGRVKLTPIQRWFLEQGIAERHHWNQAFLFEVSVAIDVDVLEQALHEVVRHHDALRLRLRAAGTEWVQEYAPVSTPEIERIDLSGIAVPERAAAIEAHAARIAASLDLARGPLLRAAHFRFGAEDRGRLLLAIHHLAVDGVSWRLIREDLEAAYVSLKSGVRPVLAQKTTSYQAWAERLHEYASSETLHRSRAFWITEANKPVTALPLERDGYENREGDARSVRACLTTEETRALLQRVPSVYRTQVNDVLLTALARALQEWTGGEAFRIDLEGHGREALFDGVDVSRTVGWFTSLFPLRLELPIRCDEASALKSIKEQLRRIPDRGLSYGLLRYLCDDSQTRAALMEAPQSALLFNYLGQFDQVTAGSQLFAFACESTGPWHSPASPRTHALEVLCMVRGGALEVEWIHHPQIHGHETIARLAQDFLVALRAIIAHCLTSRAGGRTPSDFPLVGLRQDTLDRICRRYPGLVDLYPLTPMQRLFYMMDSTRPDLGMQPWHFRLEGALDPALLRTSIERVVQRHPILRTAFVTEESEPIQAVLQHVSLPWSEEDWRGIPDTELNDRLTAFMRAEQHAAFNPSQAPLLRVALRRTREKTHHLMLTSHHLNVDGWSWPIIFSEVSAIYEALRAGREPEFAPPCDYGSYVAWLCNHAPASEPFWKETLRGFSTPTPLSLGAQPIAIEAQGGGPGEVSYCLDRDTTATLQSLARSQRVTLSTIVQGAWSLLLSHYSGLSSVVFGAAFSGRSAEVPRIDSLVGPCVNDLPVHVTVTPGEALSSWLSRLQLQQFELAGHQYTSLQQIQAWVQVPWRYRLFDSLLVFQNYRIDDAARRLGSDVAIVPVALPEATNYPLTVVATPNAALHLRLIYQRDRLAQATVRIYARDLATMLGAIAQRPDRTLAQLLEQLPAGSRAKATPLAPVTAAQSLSPYIAPATETERAVASLWQDLFGVERISLDDNFFDLGGHSVLLLQAHSRLRESLRVDLPVVALLQFPTIRTLARHLSGVADGTPVPDAARARAEKQRDALRRRRGMAEQR